MTIADRMAIFMEGRIAQIGTPDEVYARPASVGVAAFIGSPPMNLLPARIHGSNVVVARTEISLGRDLSAARGVILGVRPGALRLGSEGLPARVYLVEHLGDSTIVNLQVEDVLVKLRTDKPPRLAEGESVGLSFDPEDAHLFDEKTGLRL
jgi:ABC-type sugar transport system ATPase subunit